MGTVKKTETGSVLSFNTYLSKTLDETKISFTPKQSGSGTPSPENVREIVGKTSITVYQQGDDGVTHETSVSFPAVGKNLCPDISTWESGYTNNTGGISSANSTRLEKYSDYIPVDELENYTFSYNADGITEQLWTCICAYDENKEYLIRHTSNSNFVSQKLIAGTRFVRLSCRTYGMTTEAQFEKSSEPTAYEPFDNTIYGGYVDLVNGEVVAEWTKVDMGERNWAFTWNTFNTAPSNYIGNGVNGTPAEIMCDIYPSDINTSATGVGVINKNIRGRANYKHICIRDDDYTTAEDFKTAVTGHYLAYKLAEPIHYPLSPRAFTTLKGVNTMWSDGDSLTISYTDDVVNTYDFRRHISLSSPHKASASGAVASFGTDMVGKMKCKIHFAPQQEGSGTPSPDNVRNISGRSSVKLWQSGKNLYPATASSSTYQAVNLKMGVNYTFSAFTEGTPYFRLKFEDDTISGIVWMRNETSDGRKYLTLAPSKNVVGAFIYLGVGLTEPMIEVGSEPTTYEPYIAPNEITFTFPSTVGDNGVVYGGYLDAEKGEVVEEYVYRDMTTFSSIKAPSGTSEPWNHRFSLQHWANNTTGYDRVAGAQVMCDCIDTANGSGRTNYTGDASTAVWYVYDDTISTVAEFKEKYAGHYVAYRRKVVLHEHYSLSPQSIATLRGSNRLWSDGDSVEVEYYKHTDEPQEYLPIDAIVTNNGFVLVTSDGYAVGEANDYIKY